MSLTERFAKALRFYRELAGLSQEEVARRAELDRTYVSQLERGLKSPTLTSLQRLAVVLGVAPEALLSDRHASRGPRVPKDYSVRAVDHVVVRRRTGTAAVPAVILTSAINLAHELIDAVYSVDLDIAEVLGMRNLSAFIGELVAMAIIKGADGLFQPNPHQDGYPDLLLMDVVGKKEWERLHDQMNAKGPFSPFAGGGIEVKATCGSVPTPAICKQRGSSRPDLGHTRIGCMTGYDWKAHHRETNNLIGLVWDFIDGRPRIAAMCYSSLLTDADWGAIVQPRVGGGRTTSVSIMGRSGIRKMYDGWLCVLSTGGYAEFLNRKNGDTQIPTS